MKHKRSQNRLPPCSLLMAQSPMLIVRCLLSVVLQPPNQLPTKSPLSVVRCPQRTNQSSRGYQRGRANAKTSVLPTTYSKLCTSVWFCKDTKNKIAIVHLCLLMSIYVYLCLFMSTFCFLNAVTQYVVLGGLRLRFVGPKTKVVRRKEGGSRLNCRNYGVP